MGDLVRIPGSEDVELTSNEHRVETLRDRICDAIEADPTLTIAETLGILEMIKHLIMESR